MTYFFIQEAHAVMASSQRVELSLDLVRLLTRWLFHWDNIWSNAEQKQSASLQTSYWLQRVLEISRTEPESLSG